MAQYIFKDVHVTFPTEVFNERASSQFTQGDRPIVVHVPGGQVTVDALDAFKGNVPARTYDALMQIARAQQSKDGHVRELERRLNVYVDADTTLPSEPDDLLQLPRAFVIDGKGVLRDDLVGYDSRTDPIRLSLARLGLRR